jgi:hypothetical protein
LNFPSVNSELTIGQLWAEKKLDEICIDAPLDTAKDSEMKRTLPQADEDTCKIAQDPRTARQAKTKERFLRAHPDGIAHHNEKRIWYLLEFKRTS